MGHKHWKLDTDRDNIVWLTFDKAESSTNTLSAEVVAEFSAVLDALRAKNPRALIIRSGKSSGFIAGADVEEFTRITSTEEALAIVRRGWDAMNKLAALPFPTLALVNGFCMGGGLELALACRYRIAVDQPGTRFALPEVMLGILPGWGGVMRLPRVVGPTAALDMMMTGRSVDARRARRMGLVDASVPPRVMENSARMMALEAPAPRKLPFLQSLMNSAALRGIVASMARRQLAARARREHYPAPYAILDLWQKYDGDPVRAACRRSGLGGDARRRRHRAQSHPHLLPAGAHEIARQGIRLRGEARARDRRRRHGRRHRRLVRDARPHRHAAGPERESACAGDEARRGPCSSGGCATSGSSATPRTV